MIQFTRKNESTKQKLLEIVLEIMTNDLEYLTLGCQRIVVD